MSPPGPRRVFEVAELGEEAARAIVAGLELDGEHVAGVELDPEALSITVELTGQDAAGHVEAFVTAMTRTHRLVATKVVAEHAVAGREPRDVDGDLAAGGGTLLLGDGLVGLGGPLLGLFRAFERAFAELAARFGAAERHYPVLVPRALLAEAGYLDNFPQHVTFCTRLPDSLPVLESVAAAAAGARDGMVDAALVPPGHVLTPAVCLPCYPEMRGAVVDRPVVLTMANHVFRYEGAGFRPLARNWDFTVRDIVFFGRYEQLQALREQVMEATMGLCRRLDLAVSIQVANDPFFLDSGRDKAVYQRMGEVKYELLFPMPAARPPLAASSFNLHRDHYTSVYDTRLAEGGRAESACMGFGVDRWVYGLLTQHGLDPSGWPEVTLPDQESAE